VILNRVGSERHRAVLERATAAAGLPCLGALPRAEALSSPSRHLGLVQAEERPDLEAFLERAADLAERHLAVEALLALAARREGPTREGPRVRPPAQRIAVARDAAFAFAYPHLLADWRAGGAEVLAFSPLADEAVPEADLVILPGGYPELHAGRLAQSRAFLPGLRRAAERADIYGECGGYMVLGEALTDAEGRVHRMAGLLPVQTSFGRRRLHLGYRRVDALGGPFPGAWTAHEFHYATVVREDGDPLFRAWDAEGEELAPMGLRRGRVAGSFAHLIDRADGQDRDAGVGVGA
jgi:cobyrinic acid a,c-diamide synthase